MNDVVNLPALISRIAAAADVEPAVARRFLHELFALVEAKLLAGEKVEIAGIGQFAKGDDPEHPVLFRPDESLAQIVNEPFAAFSAVELNDGAIEEFEADIPQVVPEVDPEPKFEPESEPEQNPEPQPEHDIVSQPESESEPEPEPQLEAVITPQVPPIVDTTTTETAVVEEFAQELQPEETVVVTEPAAEQSQQDIDYTSAPTPAPVPVQPNNHLIWLILGILIGILLGLIAGYFAGKTMAELRLPDEYVADYDEEEDDIAYPSLTDTLAAASVVSAQSASPSQPEPAPAVLEQTPSAAPVSPTAKVAEPVYDTFSRNRYLSTMAREHYGRKNYWIFIYEANPGLGDPNKVSPGTRVLIPAKESFMEATVEATDAKAQKKLNALSKKYKF